VRLCCCAANFQEEKARAEKEVNRADDKYKRQLDREEEEYTSNLAFKRRKQEHALQLTNDQNQALYQDSRLNSKAHLHERESAHEDALFTKRRHLKSTLHETAMAAKQSRTMEMVSEKSHSVMSMSLLAASASSSSSSSSSAVSVSAAAATAVAAAAAAAGEASDSSDSSSDENSSAYFTK